MLHFVSKKTFQQWKEMISLASLHNGNVANFMEALHKGQIIFPFSRRCVTLH